MKHTSSPTKLAGKAFLFLTALSVAFTGCQKTIDDEGLDPLEQQSRVAGNAQGNHVPNELLVKFKKEIPETARQNVLARIQGKVTEKILTKAMQRHGNNDGIYLINTPLQALEAITKIKGSTEIEYAEPNYLYTGDATSDDTYYLNGSLWGMYSPTGTPKNTYGTQANTAWAAGHTGSNDVYIGIIDEGIMYNHTDLSANMWTNPGETLDGVDNDGNGYIDDIRGWDFDGNNNSIYDGTSDDHGTHVAGTIGAIGGNKAGVAGMNWNVKMIPAKFLGKRGGTTANAVKAVDYITDLKSRHSLNLPATNNSWGGGGYSKSLEDAIGRANAAEILFVAAAGNDGRNNNTYLSYPSCYTNANIISVASITSGGGLSYFSNYGATMVDIGAPGSGIYSTIPGKNGASGYASYNGTSMATPHVTGAIALYVSTRGTLSASSIKSAILTSTTSTASLSGKCVTGGRLNVSTF